MRPAPAVSSTRCLATTPHCVLNGWGRVNTNRMRHSMAAGRGSSPELQLRRRPTRRPAPLLRLLCSAPSPGMHISFNSAVRLSSSPAFLPSLERKTALSFDFYCNFRSFILTIGARGTLALTDDLHFSPPSTFLSHFQAFHCYHGCHGSAMPSSLSILPSYFCPFF